jgi:hypothetical protein
MIICLVVSTAVTLCDANKSGVPANFHEQRVPVFAANRRQFGSVIAAVSSDGNCVAKVWRKGPKSLSLGRN